MGKLFKRAPSFSFVAGWGFQDRLRSAGIRPEFVKDYTQSIEADDLQTDLIAESLHLFSATPIQQAPLQGGCETNSFHDYQLYGGISVQPSSHMPLQIKVSAGTLRSYLLKDYAATRELFSFELRRPYAALELCWLLDLRALHFKKGTYLSCSVWLQNANLQAAKIYSAKTEQEIYLRSFTSSDFQDKYKWEVRSGFSLALAFL